MWERSKSPTPGPDSLVLLELAGVLERHQVAGEIDDFAPRARCRSVNGVSRGR
jgi:hypothetical protein